MATTETVVRNQEYSSLTYRRPAAMPGHHVTRWWDRHSRNWVVQLLDEHENQIDSLYVYTLDDALDAAAHMATRKELP
jgi:hypothetical protein